MTTTLAVASMLAVASITGASAQPDDNIQTADTLAALPSCAASSLNETLQTLTHELDDISLCTSRTTTQSLQTCVQAICSPGDQLATAKFQADICNYPARDRSSTITGVTWALFSLATLFTIARILSRSPALRGSGYYLDDWTIFLCFPLAIAIAVSVTLCVEAGFGRDAWELSVNNIEDFLYWFYICQILYMVITFGSKLSLVLLYLRTWPDKAPSKFRMICWFVVVALLLTIISTVLATVLQCIPIQDAWDLVAAEANSHCTDRAVQVYAIAAVNIFFDVLVLSLPIPQIIKLDLSKLKRAGLCLVFLTGSIATICSGIRIMYMNKFANSTNVTWDYTGIGIWSIVEVFLSIVCASMPVTIGLIRRGFDFMLNRVEAIETTSLDGDDQHEPEVRRMLAMALAPGCPCCSRDGEKTWYPPSTKDSELSAPSSVRTPSPDEEDYKRFQRLSDLEKQTLATVRHELTWEAPAPQLAQVYRPEHVRVRYVPART